MHNVFVFLWSLCKIFNTIISPSETDVKSRWNDALQSLQCPLADVLWYRTTAQGTKQGRVEKTLLWFCKSIKTSEVDILSCCCLKYFSVLAVKLKKSMPLLNFMVPPWNQKKTAIKIKQYDKNSFSGNIAEMKILIIIFSHN